jgi:putative oxidoreductase
MFTNAGDLEASRNGLLWVMQLFGAILLLIAGSAKLSRDEEMIAMFAAVGIGQWFYYLTSVIEFALAFLLLIPSLSGIGALLLVPTTIGTVLIHLFIAGAIPALPIGLLITAIIVAWGRKETALHLIWRNNFRENERSSQRIRFQKFHRLNP